MRAMTMDSPEVRVSFSAFFCVEKERPPNDPRLLCMYLWLAHDQSRVVVGNDNEKHSR